MTNFTNGREAEAAAVGYLQDAGYEVLARNWRTRYCEIDIIARKAGVVYFVEVKYRRTASQGRGLEYVTSKKLRQMQFAADFWVARYNWTGEYQLAALEVGGEAYEVTNFITDYLG